MQTQAFWELFRDTGAPEAYLLYRKSQQEITAGELEADRPACI